MSISSTKASQQTFVPLTDSFMNTDSLLQPTQHLS